MVWNWLGRKDAVTVSQNEATQAPAISFEELRDRNFAAGTYMTLTPEALLELMATGAKPGELLTLDEFGDVALLDSEGAPRAQEHSAYKVFADEDTEIYQVSAQSTVEHDIANYGKSNAELLAQIPKGVIAPLNEDEQQTQLSAALAELTASLENLNQRVDNTLAKLDEFKE